MPVATHQIPEPKAARVLIFTCSCGASAMFGTGCDVRRALKSKDVTAAGTWRCSDCQRAYEQRQAAA